MQHLVLRLLLRLLCDIISSTTLPSPFTPSGPVIACPPTRCDCCCFGSPKGPLGGSSTRNVKWPGADCVGVFFFAGLLPLFSAKISDSRQQKLLDNCSNCLSACLSSRSCCSITCLSFRSCTISRFISRASPQCACRLSTLIPVVFSLLLLKEIVISDSELL